MPRAGAHKNSHAGRGRAGRDRARARAKSVITETPPPPRSRARSNRDGYFVLDVSGSMEGTRLARVKKTVTDIVPTLPPTSRMAIVTFDTGAFFKLKPRPVEQILRQGELPRILGKIYARGGTALWDAIHLVVSQIRDDTKETRIVVLTDGEDNSSTHTQAEVDALVAAKPNVMVDIIHIGDAPIAAYRDVSMATGGDYTLIKEADIENVLTVTFKLRMTAA